MRFRLDLPPPEVLDTKEEIQGLFRDLMSHDGVVGYDTETSGLEWDASVYMIQIAFVPDGRPKGRRILIPTYRPTHFIFFDILKPWFEDPSKPKVAHNAPFDYRMMANHGIEVAGLLGDTMKMHHLYDEEGRHSLKDISKRMCGLSLRSFKNIFGKKISRSTVIEVFEDPNKRQSAIDYATLDPWATYEVWELLRDRLEIVPWDAPKSLATLGVPESPTLWDQHQVLDIPFIRVLQNMERRGVPVNRDRLVEIGKPMDDDMSQITREICEEYSVSINLNSYPQVAHLLFDVVGCDPVRKTATGWSTDQNTLETLMKEGVQVAKKILDFRSISKIKGTYVDGLIKHIMYDQRIHTSLRATTVTNRLRSSNPNLLNLPNAATDRYGIRTAVEAPPGWVFVCADYSGLEMRIAAAIFGDEGMIEAILAGKDLHALTASLMYDVDYEAIVQAKKAENRTEEQKTLVGFRNSAKRTGFGINYGIGPPGLSVDLTDTLGRIVTPQEAEQYIDLYLSVRSGIRTGIERYKGKLREEGGVSTLLGRTRYPSGTYHSSYADRSSAERQAVNFPIQGTGADLIQLAMMQAEDDPTLNRLGAEMVLQIHDELLFLSPEENAEEVLERVVEIMENPTGWPGLPYDVPVEAEGGIAKTWAEAK